MSTVLQDIKQSGRMLIQNPGFTAVAVAALALGIGANTAIFSVINGVLLQPLPYSHANRMVRMAMQFPGGNGQIVSIPKFMTWKQNTTGQDSSAFAYVCAYDFAGPGLNLSGGDIPEQVKGIHVSADFFPVFEATPMIGRFFSPTEDIPNGPKLAVMSHGLWIRRFGGDPRIIGRAVTLNGEPYTITGVLNASFRSYPPADIYLPLQADPNSTNQGHFLASAALLKPGVSLEAGKAQMKVAAERFRAQYPNSIGKNESATIIPFQESVVGDVQRPLMILLGAVALVLLISCANVANLLLARATARTREIAIRTALGAGRWRIIRQLLTESLMLAAIGGVAGLLLGLWGSRALLALAPASLPRAAEFSQTGLVDWRILLFTLGITAFTGLLFGFFPALQISRADVASTIKEAGSRSGTGRNPYARNALVVAETALALILLVGAALMIRTFDSLRQVNPGFDPRNVLSFETSLGGEKYTKTANVDLLTRDAVQKLERLPGVIAAANVPYLPLEGGFGLGFQVVGRPNAPGERGTGGAGWMYVSESYFKALGIPLRRGRLFNERDTGASPRVVIINEAFAKTYFPKGNPLGERLEIGKEMGPDFAEGPREIVGVIADVKENGLNNPAPEEMYIPLAQLKDSFIALNNTMAPMTWVVKTAVDPMTLSAQIKKEMLTADGQLAVSRIRPASQSVLEATSREDFIRKLLTIFAGIALVLAAIGIYGMLSYTVRQRSQEIGIRIALGAARPDVLRLVIGQGMKLALLGVAVGLAGAFGLSRFMAAMLFGVKPYDPLTFAVVSVILASVALLACWIPARRAMRVDPMIALRYE